MPLEIGQVFAGYKIVRVLGAGGMGTVYLAAHPRLPREDALKVLPPDLTTDPEFRGRFVREAELAAGLIHPHIVGIHDRGEEDGQFWISMDYVAGADVARVLLEDYPNGMPVHEAMSITTAVASALDYAHHRELLHRDVKPANILLTDPDGQERRVYLADFGIARRMEDAAGLTATNMTVGTVAYAAPEQLRGEWIDGRADQYALACTAFHLLTGAPPYVHSNPAVVITQHVTAPPASIGARRPELAALDSVFATAMAKKPSGRFRSCGEFAEQLSRQLRPGASYSRDIAVPETRPIHGITAPTVWTPAAPPIGKRRRRGVVIGALVGAALLIAGGVFAAVKLTEKPNPTAMAGPFTGTYTTDFGGSTGLDDIPESGASPQVTGTYGFRSVCRSTGCVATASRLGGPPVVVPTMVLDEVGGRWVGVVVGSDQCHGATNEIWQVLTVEPRPDGGFAGEYLTTSANGCATKRTVTLTRTADVDDKSVSDPAAQRPRVVSPAEALRGHYHVSRTFTNGIPPMQSDSMVTTYCLRAGDRCMSYFHEPSADVPLVFGGGKWVWDVNGGGVCPKSGEATQVKDTAQYPLPQPPQDPIAVLTGHGHHEQTAPCVLNADFDETFTRVGD